ncbi:hypothetical protein [Salinivibrio sp. SS2]|uniref:hypothetical protein n=1 Tax=Salinivibrio sp. SS2 TaxID=1892894 RepID=UPI00084C4333|nr:hypothetical protein [Salinivibrio sp. DV]ODQ01509.1 hypothetical protein BGK46_02295 [Salinivibrio sp. DV]
MHPTDKAQALRIPYRHAFHVDFHPVLTSTQHSAPYFADEVKGTLSLPSFHQHFDPTSGLVTDTEFNQRLDTIISHL